METENKKIQEAEVRSQETGVNSQGAQVQYDDENIRTLTGLEHIRLRPGMYIGKLDDGSKPDDGIYVLLKEVFDNSIDEFKMKAGDRIEVTIEDNGSRLRTRHPAGKAHRLRQHPEHQRKVRLEGFQKVYWSERRGCQGCQCPEQPFRGAQLS